MPMGVCCVLSWILCRESRADELADPPFSLLLQPTSFSPAFDLALTSLVEAVHDPVKDDITNKQCASDYLLWLARLGSRIDLVLLRAL